MAESENTKFARIDPRLFQNLRIAQPLAVDFARLRPEVISSLPQSEGAPPPVIKTKNIPPQALPEAPADDPFASLPYPNPGDSIKSDDFRMLSKSLKLLQDTFNLSGALVGSDFGEAKQRLADRNYQIVQVLTVYGKEMSPEDPSLEERKIVQVVPKTLGGTSVAVVVTEAAATHRTMPRLTGMTPEKATEHLRSVLADLPLSGQPIEVPNLVGMSLTEAKKGL